MEFLSTFKSELFRPLTTIVVPGAFAIGPFIVVLSHYIPAVNKFWGDHPSAFVTILTICVLAAGLVLENLGATFEYYVLDRILKKTQPGHKDRWESYLKLKIADEYVGQRYLRNTLVRMKFELSMPWALLAFGAGIAWINRLFGMWSFGALASIETFVLFLAVFLAWESYQSATVLARTRELLLDAVPERT